MPTFGVSAGLPTKHRRPKAGDVWLEGRLKVQRWGQVEWCSRGKGEGGWCSGRRGVLGGGGGGCFREGGEVCVREGRRVRGRGGGGEGSGEGGCSGRGEGGFGESGRRQMFLPVGSRSCEDPGRVQSSGLVQVPRGRQCPAQCNSNQRNPGSRRSIKSVKDKVNSDAARDAVRNTIFKLEKALEVLSDSTRPAVDALKSELEKARQAAKVPPLNMQISSTHDFIRRSERRLAELEAERTAEAKLLVEARERLRQLEAARCAQEAVASSPSATPLDLGTQVQTLQQVVNQLQEERDALRRKSRAALWRDPKCANGCPCHMLQKTLSHQCQHWFHESSASGWKTVSQTCKRPCRAGI